MASRVMDQTMMTLTSGHDSTNSSAFINRGSDDVLDVIRMDTQEAGLDFHNSEHPPDLLVAMGTLRRQNQFCDAVLRVDEREVGGDRGGICCTRHCPVSYTHLTLPTSDGV